MAKSKRNFVWGAWDYDCDGEAYIIAKDACPNSEDVPDFICHEDRIPAKCKSEIRVQDGWCRWELRSDWDGGYGDRGGGYCIYDQKVPRAFPVWIVRKEEWY